MSYEKRYAYLDYPASSSNQILSDIKLVLTENGRFMIASETSAILTIDQEQARLLLPLLRNFAEHGNIQSKTEIDEMQVDGLLSRRLL